MIRTATDEIPAAGTPELATGKAPSTETPSLQVRRLSATFAQHVHAASESAVPKIRLDVDYGLGLALSTITGESEEHPAPATVPRVSVKRLSGTFSAQTSRLVEAGSQQTGFPLQRTQSSIRIVCKSVENLSSLLYSPQDSLSVLRAAAGDIDELLQKLNALVLQPPATERELHNTSPRIDPQVSWHLQPSRWVMYRGTNADDIVEQKKTPSETKETKYLIAYLVAYGLEKLHALGLCHMNVKPSHVEIGFKDQSNILYGRLVDEGSVVPIGQPWRRITPIYMDIGKGALHEKVADPVYDMFSFGLLLFELLYGRASNPLVLNRTYKKTVDEWKGTISTMCSRLSATDPVEQLIANLLGPPEQRSSSRSAGMVLLHAIGEERCEQLVSGLERARAVERIWKPCSAIVLLQSKRMELLPEKKRVLYRFAYDVAQTLSQMHKAKLVHMNIRSSNVQLIPSGSTGEPSARLLCTPECVAKEATPADDCWALGSMLWEWFYGVEANPFRTVTLDSQTKCIDDTSRELAVKAIRDRPVGDDPIDRILMGLLNPPSTRMTIEQVVEHLSIVVSPVTAIRLLRAPKNALEWRERVYVAYGVAKDYQEKVPRYFVTISPKSIELACSRETGHIVGARVVGEIPRPEPLGSSQEETPFHNRLFGLLLFGFFYGSERTCAKFDFDHLPDEKSPTWEAFLEGVKKYLEPEKTKRYIDKVIWQLLTRKDCRIEYYIGILRALLEEDRPDQIHLQNEDPTQTVYTQTS